MKHLSASHVVLKTLKCLECHCSQNKDGDENTLGTTTDSFSLFCTKNYFVLVTKEFAIKNKENKSFSVPRVISTPSLFCIQRHSGHFHIFRRRRYNCFSSTKPLLKSLNKLRVSNIVVNSS